MPRKRTGYDAACYYDGKLLGRCTKADSDAYTDVYKRQCGNRAKKSRRSRKRKLRPAEMPSGKPRATLARGFLFPEIVRGPPG